MFLSFKPHEDELDIEIYITQPYCFLAKKLHSTIFPVYVSIISFLVYQIWEEGRIGLIDYSPAFSHLQANWDFGSCSLGITEDDNDDKPL